MRNIQSELYGNIHSFPVERSVAIEGLYGIECKYSKYTLTELGKSIEEGTLSGNFRVQTGMLSTVLIQLERGEVVLGTSFTKYE